MTVYEQLEAKCLPFMEHWKEDLTVHDRKSIEENGQLPFLHWTRETGTYICFLRPLDSLPGKGQYEPFLFGHADRDRLSRVPLDTAQYAEADEKLNEFKYLVHYFDGRNLREITSEKAVDIANEYLYKIQQAIKHEHKRSILHGV